MTGIIMFFAALLMLGIGYPVAFTFGSISIFFGIIAAVVAVAPDISYVAVSDEFLRMFSMMPFRVYSIMNNTILMAIPLFIFMGIVLQRSQLAERLLEAMGTLFGRVRGGIAVSTVLVGALLAASTGVVGASVVAMGVISLPVMLKYGYSKTAGHRHHLCRRHPGADHPAFGYPGHSRRRLPIAGRRSVRRRLCPRFRPGGRLHRFYSRSGPFSTRMWRRPCRLRKGPAWATSVMRFLPFFRRLS